MADISLGDLESYLRRAAAFDGTHRPYSDGSPMTLGDVSSDPGTRNTHGPLILDYLTSRVLTALPPGDILETPTINAEAQLAKKALRRFYALRETTDGRSTYNSAARRSLHKAAARRASSRLIEAAFTAREAFSRHMAGELAGDVVVALGSVSMAQIAKQLERDAQHVEPVTLGPDAVTVSFDLSAEKSA